MTRKPPRTSPGGACCYAPYHSPMARREREIFEHTVRKLAEQAAKADDLVDEAKVAGGGDHPVAVHAKMPRTRTPQGEGRPRAGARDVVAELLEVRSRRALGLGARRLTRTLGHTLSPRRTASRRSSRERLPASPCAWGWSRCKASTAGLCMEGP